MTAPVFDLCVVLYRAPKETRAFLESLALLDPGCPFTLSVLDNSPDDDAWNVLHEPQGFGEACVEAKASRDPSNPGFAAGINELAGWGGAPYVAMLNPDTQFLEPDTLSRLAAAFDEQPQVAMQGPRQFTTAGQIVHAGWAWSQDGGHQRQRGGGHADSGAWTDTLDVEMITGSALFCRRTVWDELGGCPNYRRACPDATGPMLPTQHFFEDSLLCAHAFAHGYRLLYRGDINMIHEVSRSASPSSQYVARAWRESRPTWRAVMNAMGLSTVRTPQSLS